MIPPRRFLAVVAVMATFGPAPGSRVAARQTTDESAATSYYKSGQGYLEQGNYEQAMKDFDRVVKSFPSSSVAPYAQLAMAKYQLEVKGEPAAARTIAETLIEKYATSDAASMAWIVSGRSRLAVGRAPADLDAALADFDHVRVLSGRSDSMPESLYYGAETRRFAGRLDDAIARYRDVALQYPRSPWAARAALGAATCFAFKGMPTEAFDELQRVRLRFPQSPEATQALAWNTTLFRLFLRGAQPAYTFSGRAVTGPAGKLKGVAALAVDHADNLFVANDQAVTVFKPDGSRLRTVTFAAARALFNPPAGKLIALGKTGLQAEDGLLVPLSVAKSDGSPKRLEDLSAVVSVATGEVLVGDADSKKILRFSSSGKPLGPFAAERGDRLAINALDEVAALDIDGKSIAIVDRSGRTLYRIAAKGTGYDLRNPADIAYDQLGHLFVLDRGAGAVLVFDHAGKLVSTFAIPDKAPGSFRGATAMTLDGAANLFIYDPHAERVQIYQ